MLDKIKSLLPEKQEHDGLDVLDDLKEPFSFENFFEEQVIARWKKFRKLLEEHGVMFFLISPFQYRNRLILKLSLMVLGVVVGVVPRSMSMVDAAKERNAMSAMSTIQNSVFTSGKLTITPLASSQYEKQHMLTFLLGGDTANGVPSTTNRYDVRLAASRGVSDAQNVHYRYEIVPIDNTSRLLLVYVDNREQNDETGIYDLFVSIADEEIPIYQQVGMELSLGNMQTTTQLFSEDGVDLSVLTNLISESSTAIQNERDKLDKNLETYQLNEERLNAGGVTLSMTTAELRDYVEKNIMLPDMRDDSTTKDLTSMDNNLSISGLKLDVYVALKHEDKVYDAELKNNTKEPNHTEKSLFAEYDDLKRKMDSVLNSVRALSSQNIAKHNRLLTMETLLNQDVDVTTFSGSASVQ